MKRTIAFRQALIGITIMAGTVSAPIALAERDANIPSRPFHTNKHWQHNNNHRNSHRGCAQYRLSAYGGEAGFRLMNNKQDFRRASNGSVVGRICSGGRATIELSKRHPRTHVALQINGREYVFGRGDRGDRIENHWFRRYIKVDLHPRPGHREHYSGQDADHRSHQNHYWDQEYSEQYDDDFMPFDHQYGHKHYGQNLGRGYNSHNAHRNPRPWLRVDSKRHLKAHRKGIAHRHRNQHYAYH